MLTKKLIFPLALVFYEVLVYLSTDMYLPALPSMQKDFSLLTHDTQKALSVWFLGAGCCQWITGPLSDYYGRRPVLLISITIYIIACSICAWTGNYSLFLTARFVQGGMIGPIFVAGYAAIHEKFDNTEAVKILATMSCITIFAPTIGPMLGAVILKQHSWHQLFLFLAALSSIAGLVLFLSMPETLESRIEICLKKITRSYFEILRNQKFMLPVIANCCTFAAMIAWLTMSAFISDKHGLSAMDYGYMQLCVFGCYIIGNRAISLLIGKYQKSQIVYAGLSISLLGGAALFLAYLQNSSLSLGLATISTITLGAGMCGPNLQKLAMEHSKQTMGLNLSVYSTMISINGAIISLIVSFLDVDWNTLIGAMLSCILFAFILHKTWKVICHQ